MRIACFGGSFNPPHKGHLAIALQALRQAHFDEVWFIPSRQAPLREDAPVSFEHRVAMIQAMIKPYRKLRVCSIEAQLPQPSYTITTVTTLIAEYPDCFFAWIIGSDQANQFDQWKDAAHLRTLLPFYVVPRASTDAIPLWMKRLDVPGIEQYSSTRFRAGEVQVAPYAVIRESARFGLYFDSMVNVAVGSKRWKHIAGVVSVAVDLALHHGIDPNAASIAALLHDLTKPWPTAQQKAWLSFCDPTYSNQPDAILHQKTAVAYARRVLGVHHQDILHAIGHHVDGSSEHPLTQILYIADKCEPSRGYDATSILALARRDLKKASALVRQSQLEYLNQENHGTHH
jgi:nicotinate-nucleotide adenylyltransferase